jgi:hypothetical protein
MTSCRRFSGEIPRQILDAELSAASELSGVLNRALAALPSILGRRLPMTDSMRAAWEEFRSASDWLILWLERTVIWNETGVIEKRALYNAFLIEVQRQRRAAVSPVGLYNAVRRHWPKVEESQRRLDPNRNSLACFVGITWRSGIPPL